MSKADSPAAFPGFTTLARLMDLRTWPGLSKRELFAAMAMQSLAGKPSFQSMADIVEASTAFADALLAELDRAGRNKNA